MLGEVFSQACNYASAAAFAVTAATAEPPPVDLNDLPPRVEMVGMSITEPQMTIPGVHTPAIESTSNTYMPEAQSNESTYAVDSTVANLMKPPEGSEMQVRYLKESNLDQNYTMQPNGFA